MNDAAARHAMQFGRAKRGFVEFNGARPLADGQRGGHAGGEAMGRVAHRGAFRNGAFILVINAIRFPRGVSDFQLVRTNEKTGRPKDGEPVHFHHLNIHFTHG